MRRFVLENKFRATTSAGPVRVLERLASDRPVGKFPMETFSGLKMSLSENTERILQKSIISYF